LPDVAVFALVPLFLLGLSLDLEQATATEALTNTNRNQLLHDTMLIQCPRLGSDDTRL